MPTDIAVLSLALILIAGIMHGMHKKSFEEGISMVAALIMFCIWTKELAKMVQGE